MKLTNSLTGKISLGYITIAIISVASFLISLLILNNNKDTDKEISEYSVPSLLLYKDLNTFNREINRLNYSLLHTPNQTDKQNLKTLITEEYPPISNRITKFINQSKDSQNKADLKKSLDSFSTLVSQSGAISSALENDPDDTTGEALASYEKKFLPTFNNNTKQINTAIQKGNENLVFMQQKKESSYNTLSLVLVLTLIIILLTGFISLSISKKIIIKPLNALKDIINRMGGGEIVEIADAKREDEIGEMQKSIKSMISGFKSNTDFAIEIGKGNYDVPFQPLSLKDNLGNALLEMRSNLKSNTENENKRSWATTGIANIGELLRKNDANETELYDSIMSFIIKYMNANQGGLFIVENDPGTDEIYLELKACYAYSKKKFNERRIEIGEGLVGQCYIEAETIYMTEIPSGYVSITSGLGGANPSVLAIIPLKVNEVIFGILEVASFTFMDKYQIDFLEKVAESVGSVISSVKMNQRTRKLLEDSQMQSEALRAQEEEMRQNMEELSATQEEMSRKEQEYIQVIEELKSK